MKFFRTRKGSGGRTFSKGMSRGPLTGERKSADPFAACCVSTETMTAFSGEVTGLDVLEGEKSEERGREKKKRHENEEHPYNSRRG